MPVAKEVVKSAIFGFFSGLFSGGTSMLNHGKSASSDDGSATSTSNDQHKSPAGTASQGDRPGDKRS
jgi:hypothetical protein